MLASLMLAQQYWAFYARSVFDFLRLKSITSGQAAGFIPAWRAAAAQWAFRHCCPELMDWEAMVDLLAEEPGAGEDVLRLGDTEAPVAVVLLGGERREEVDRLTK